MKFEEAIKAKRIIEKIEKLEHTKNKLDNYLYNDCMRCDFVNGDKTFSLYTDNAKEIISFTKKLLAEKITKLENDLEKI